MKNKLLLVVLSALGLGVTGAGAQTAASAPAPSWVVTPAFVSQYMFRGVRLGGPSFQPTVEYDRGPWVGGLWANFPMADKVPGQSNPEFDLYGSYTETVSDSLNFASGFTLYYYPEAEKNNGFYRYTFEPSVTVNYTISGLKLSPKFCYYLVLNGPTLELGAAYAIPLKAVGTELDFTGTIGTYKWARAAEDTVPDVKNYGNYWLLGVSAPFQVTPNSKLILGWAYTRGTANYLKQGSAPKVLNPGAVGRGVASVSYSLTF